MVALKRAGLDIGIDTAIVAPLRTRRRLGGLFIAAAAWIVLARACKNGHSWARTAGTVLFALATVDSLVGASAAPIAGAVRLWGLVTWLAGLVAVILLWRRPSTDFFKGRILA
jgi:hypothetical protein